MTDEGLYSPTVTPCQDECHPVSVNIYCTLSLCKAATEVVNYTKSGWEHVVTLANEGETQWHSISTLASPFSLFTFLCGFAVTWSSLLICALWPLETPGHTHTLVFLFIFLWGLTVFFSKHWHLKSVKTPAAETNKLNPKSATSSWTLKKTFWLVALQQCNTKVKILLKLTLQGKAMQHMIFLKFKWKSVMVDTFTWGYQCIQMSARTVTLTIGS